jgi:hypothetical protein
VYCLNKTLKTQGFWVGGLQQERRLHELCLELYVMLLVLSESVSFQILSYNLKKLMY